MTCEHICLTLRQVCKGCLSFSTFFGTLSGLSGYKVSMQKSEFMPINPTCHLTSTQSLLVKICTYKFKYFSIWITHKFKDLSEANFPPLLNCARRDLDRWNHLPLSPGGK